MPELRHLRVFVAVAEELSFTRAAEGLHLTQQTVSRTIGDLERELGVELLERTTRQVRLTSGGAALLEPAREALRHADAAFTTARAAGTAQAGTVQVGITPAVGPDDCGDVVRALRFRAADVSVALRELRPGDLRRSLRAGEVDIVLSRVSGVGDPSVHVAPLRPTTMDVFAPSDHPLAGLGGARLRDLDGARLLTASAAGTPYTELLVARFAQDGATVTPVESHVTGGSYAMLTELHRLDAVAVTPASATPPAGVVGLGVADLTMPLVMLWPAGRPSPAVLRLRDAMAADP